VLEFKNYFRTSDLVPGDLIKMQLSNSLIMIIATKKLVHTSRVAITYVRFGTNKLYECFYEKDDCEWDVIQRGK